MNLDIALQLLSITFTVLLAGVGILLAIKPPATRGEKRVYVLIFILFGLSLAGVTYWQAVHTSNEQISARNEANAKQQQLSVQYGLLQGKLDNINQFVAHPPPNLDLIQVSDAVRAMAGNTARSQKEQSDAAFKQTLDAASALFGELQYLAGMWQAEDERTRSSMAMTPDAKKKQKAVSDKTYLDQAQPLMIAANDYRLQLLGHLPPGQNADNLKSDETEAAVFADVVAKRSISPEEARQAAWYLGQLINRVVNKVN